MQEEEDDGDIALASTEQAVPGVEPNGSASHALKEDSEGLRNSKLKEEQEEKDRGSIEDQETEQSLATEAPSPLPNPPIVIQSPIETNNPMNVTTTQDELEHSNESYSPVHRRLDSIPPRRYEIETQSSNAFAPSQNDETGQETQSSHSWPMKKSYSETEDAGLDFVEVELDRSGDSKSPYGGGSHFASRSAVEIRQDSISSNSEAARKVALEAEGRQNRTSGHYLHQRTRSNSDDESVSSRGSRRTERSVEGRYMGRRSRGTSPETNGRTHRPASTSGASPFPQSLDTAPIEAGIGTITMAVAGVDGEVSMVTTPAPITPAATHGREDTESVQSSEHSIALSKQEEDHKEVAGERTSDDVAQSAENGGAQEATMSTAASANSLSDVADKEQGKRKKKRESSNKPSALEQHMSRTRMMNLPPKSKQEDVKHLHDYEEMMKLSREKETKRQQELEEKRRQRDAELQENMKVWESDILPSWTRARREAHLRKLWWKGIPPSIRGRLWAMACGNNQMLPRNLFSKASAEAEQRIRQGTFPLGDLRAIEADIEQTLPSLKLFQKEIGALHSDLYSVLCALVIVRLDQSNSIGKGKGRELDQDDGFVRVYQQGFASLSAMLMSNLSPSETLVALLNLIAERPWLSALYTSARREEAAAFERVFDTLLADQMPKVYANMQARGVRPSAYVTTWVKTLFVPFLPFDLVARLWDCILLEEGDALIFRIAIGLYSLLSARLYAPDKQELISVLKGNNRAALSVWQRIRASGTADATSPPPLSPSTDQNKRFSINVEASDDMVPLDNIYGGQYDINETNLFQVLEEQVSWWKDSTLERLLDRELVT